MALLFPGAYPLAASNLGLQLVYGLLNAQEHLVCERFVCPSGREPFRSLESNRPLSDFPLIFGSVSFEQDYSRLAWMLLAGGVPPLAADRSALIQPGNPLLVLGGVALMINPEPLAPFADCVVIGEAEAALPGLLEKLSLLGDGAVSRTGLLQELMELEGCYIPSLYAFSHDREGRVLSVQVGAGAPVTVRRVLQRDMNQAGHSQLLSPDAELSMFLAELGRGCSRGCRFCAAGFVYRPPRLWEADAVLEALAARPGHADRVGLLGMEMASSTTLERISGYLAAQGCALSFSSLRADRISDSLLSLLADSRLKSVALAPDGCSERLRRVINKGLTETDLLHAAVRLVDAGIVHLKLYVMVGLPTETEEDLAEFVRLLRRLCAAILPAGRRRGQVAEITLSVNSFVPKPWTPFQYHSYGGQEVEAAHGDTTTAAAIVALEGKIGYLRQNISSLDNIRMKADSPGRVLEQAVLARGDRRLAGVLLDMASGKKIKPAMKAHGLLAWEYAVRPRERKELFCWDHIDHGITKDYLWQEYQRAAMEKWTPPCDPARCHRCGVCPADVPWAIHPQPVSER